MENLLVGIFVGIVVFVIYLSNSAKKSEMKEKEKQDEFAKRLDNLSNLLDANVSIKEEVFEKDVEAEKSEETHDEPVVKFKAKRGKKAQDSSDEEII